MEDNNVVEFAGRDAISDPLTDLLRTGARQLLMHAIEAEVQEDMTQFSDHKTEEGKASVVRNSYHPERPIQTGVGPVTVKLPKVRSKTGEPVTFHSALILPYVRKAKYPKATLCLQKDREELMAFFDFPAEHWKASFPVTQLNLVLPLSAIVQNVQKAV